MAILISLLLSDTGNQNLLEIILTLDIKLIGVVFLKK